MSNNETPSQIHATAISIDGKGVLLLGPSGAGKSDLALRMIDRGAKLVADDRVDMTPQADAIILSAPVALAGLIEAHGLGIFRLPCVTAPLSLSVELVPSETIERLPEPDIDTVCGRSIPKIRLAPFEQSAPIKLELALRQHPIEAL